MTFDMSTCIRIILIFVFLLILKWNLIWGYFYNGTLFIVSLDQRYVELFGNHDTCCWLC